MKNACKFTAALGIALCCSMPSLARCQNLTDWKVDAPPNSVQLVSVEPVGDVEDNFLKFTFKNVSGKSIIELRVLGPDGAGEGRDWFDNDGAALQPEASFSLDFSKHDRNNANNEPRALRIDAVVYSDGTRAGKKKELDDLEGEMIGGALERKRDTSILTASPDPSIAGFDVVAEEIAKPLPSAQIDPTAEAASDAPRRVVLHGIPQTYTLSSAKELADSLRGIALDGVPQSYIDRYLDHPDPGFYGGVLSTRSYVLVRIEVVKSNTAITADLPQDYREYRKKLQSHALADLAQKFSAVCEKQAHFYRTYLGIPEAAQ